MKTILIVDDEQSIGEIIKEYLRRITDYIVLTAIDSDQALEHFKQGHIDLMITNINMPGMDGIELTRYVTKLYDTKVIIATAYGGYQDNACDAGAIEYILKPIRLESFLKLINNILLIKGNATIHKLFLSLLKEYSIDKFFEIREKISESDQYSPYSTELDEISCMALEQEGHQHVINTYYSTFPNLLLSPGAHFTLSYAYNELGNEGMVELEKHITFLLINCIIKTGDGTKEHPYFVLRTSDEYDVLDALGEKSREQALISDKGRFLDRQICDNGTEIYFDITIPYATLNDLLPFKIQKKIL